MIDTDGIEWLTTAETADRLGIAPSTVRSWVARGKIRAHKITGQWWVHWPDAMDAERDTHDRYLTLRHPQLHA